MGSEDETSDPYDHAHEMDECAEFSDRHKQFITEHLDMIKKQCREFKVCRNELYSQENLHIILQGGDVDLNLICGFLYPSHENSTNADSECTFKERTSIKEDISNKLKASIEIEDHHSKWEEVKECLHNNTEETHEHLDQICSLAAKQDSVCNTRVHYQLESFLNHQLEHIQCTCNSIRRISPRFPFKYRLAATGGGLLFLILLIIFVVCMCRRRKKNKKKRKSQEENLQRVNYHISRGSEVDLNDDHYSMCQEPIYKPKGSVTVAAPQLPPRYTKYPRDKTDPTFDYLLPADLPQNSPVPDKGSYLVDRGGLISPDGASIEDITEQKECPRRRYDPLGPRSEEANYSKTVSETNAYVEPLPDLEKNHIKNTYFILEGESQEQKQNHINIVE